MAAFQWNAVRLRLMRLHFGCVLSTAPRVCVRKAGSDLNPNHLLVFICIAPNEQLRGYVADLPISLLCFSVRCDDLTRTWRAKGRIEVRERKLKLRRHVPVRALKPSVEGHVDASSVQQTLVSLDSFTASIVAR